MVYFGEGPTSTYCTNYVSKLVISGEYCMIVEEIEETDEG